MIHEIAPVIMDNQYYDKKPDQDTRICFIRSGKLFLRKERGKISWPLFEEFADKACAAEYLFSIGGKKYFLGNPDMEPENIDGEWFSWREIRDQEPKEEIFAGMTAMHLQQWYASVRYCGRCGEKAVHAEKERMMRCPSCGNMMFPKISPAIVVAVKDEKDRLLLTKYAGKINDQYALVAGFVEIGETAEECVQRELMEEVGIKVKNIRYYASQPWGFAGNLMMGFTAELDGSDKIRLDRQELSIAEWIGREEIPDIEDYSSLTREMIRRFKYGKLPF